MGFSVSGSAAIVFVGLFIAFGAFYTASTNTMEQVTDARSDWQDRDLNQHNTDIDITAATYNTTADRLTVETNNTGAVTLSVNETDLIADNEYLIPDRSDVNGDASTDVWATGQRLTLNVSLGTQPNRVKVTTGTGVAATEVVTRG